MDKNLEKNFKDAFEQYELPYNASAWETLSKKLDLNDSIASSNKSKGNYLKWILGASIIAVLAVATLLINRNSAAPSQQMAIVDQSATNNKITEQLVDNIPITDTKTSTSLSKSVIESDNNIKKPHLESSVNSNLERSSTPKETIEINQKGVQEPIVDNLTKEILQKSDQPTSDFQLPLMSQTVCQATEKIIENPNKTDAIIIDPKGNKTIIKANSSKKITFNQTGEYLLHAANNSSLKAIVTVKDTPLVDFHITDELVYENGIPTTIAVATEKSAKYEWKVNDVNYNQNKSEFNGHFYKKGNYVIQLTQTNQNGCKSAIAKEVRIEENYNLLAPSAFMPTSSDGRKNKFIPYALTVRNTEFRMIIIEPRSGNVLFETSSIDGWDGIDPNTKQLVQENNSYVWKVILSNPEKGEPREYSGIVTRL